MSPMFAPHTTTSWSPARRAAANTRKGSKSSGGGRKGESEDAREAAISGLSDVPGRDAHDFPGAHAPLLARGDLLGVAVLEHLHCGRGRDTRDRALGPLLERAMEQCAGVQPGSMDGGIARERRESGGPQGGEGGDRAV